MALVLIWSLADAKTHKTSIVGAARKAVIPVDETTINHSALLPFYKKHNIKQSGHETFFRDGDSESVIGIDHSSSPRMRLGILALRYPVPP
jgi:hypothetical protein